MAAAGDAKTQLFTIKKIAMTRAMRLPVEVMDTLTPQFFAEFAIPRNSGQSSTWSGKFSNFHVPVANLSTLPLAILAEPLRTIGAANCIPGSLMAAPICSEPARQVDIALAVILTPPLSG